MKKTKSIITIALFCCLIFAAYTIPANAAKVDIVDVSWIEHVSIGEMGTYTWIDNLETETITFENGYTYTEKVTDLSTKAGKLSGNFVYKHERTYTTY